MYDLTDPQLDVLIVAYYEKVGLAFDGRTDGEVFIEECCRHLVNLELVRYTAMAREVIAVRSWSSPSGLIVTKYPGPTTYKAAAITKEGKRVVEKVATSRRIEACIAMSSPDTAKALASTLSTEELPLLLASECEFVRNAAKGRLIALGKEDQVKEDSGGRIYFIDPRGGHVACITGIADGP